MVNDTINIILFVLSKELNNKYCKIVAMCVLYPYIIAFINYEDPLENFDRRLFTDNLDEIPTKLYEERQIVEVVLVKY